MVLLREKINAFVVDSAIVYRGRFIDCIIQNIKLKILSDVLKIVFSVNGMVLSQKN